MNLNVKVLVHPEHYRDVVNVLDGMKNLHGRPQDEQSNRSRNIRST